MTPVLAAAPWRAPHSSDVAGIVGVEPDGLGPRKRCDDDDERRLEP